MGSRISVTAYGLPNLGGVSVWFYASPLGSDSGSDDLYFVVFVGCTFIRGGGGMKVHYKDDGFMLSPETDFERDFLTQFSAKTLRTWLKCGVSASQVVGLVFEFHNPLEEVEK